MDLPLPTMAHQEGNPHSIFQTHSTHKQNTSRPITCDMCFYVEHLWNESTQKTKQTGVWMSLFRLYCDS